MREAYEAHRRRQEEEANEQPSISPTQILARIAKMKPLTLNDLQVPSLMPFHSDNILSHKTSANEYIYVGKIWQAETNQVQSQVDDFNQRIEEVIWNYKQEQFQQNLKFVQDKDTAWNK